MATRFVVNFYMLPQQPQTSRATALLLKLPLSVSCYIPASE